MTTLLKSNAKKALVFVLLLALIITPFGSVLGEQPGAGTVSQKQIGDYVDLNEDGTPKWDSATSNAIVKKTSEDGKNYIEHSKTIEPTDTEDVFKINLEVKTNEVREATTDVALKAHDVVIMMDVSGSMEEGDRWPKSQEAVSKFLDDYLDPDGVGYAEGNRVAIGSFSGSKNGFLSELLGDQYANDDHNSNVCGWTTDLTAAKATISGNIDSLKGSRQGGGTNMQAGFVGANELFSKAGGTNDKILIFVSDGAASFYYDGNGYTVGPGTGYDLASVNAANAEMDKLRGQHSNLRIFTLGIGADQAKNAVLVYKENEEGGVDKSFNASDEFAIPQVFASILNEILLGVDPWTVEDPMSDWVEFLGFDKNYGVDEASFDDTKKSILWNLEENYVGVTGTANARVWTYKMGYYVKIDKEAQGFVYDQLYPTNKETKVNFAFTETVNGKKVILDEQDSKFMIPTVKANKIKGTITITKKDKGDNNAVLNGGEFVLLDKDQKEVATATAIEGLITFGGVDWGDYTVKERKAPNGYDKDSFKLTPSAFTVTGDAINVTGEATNVKLGSITLNKKDGTSDADLSGGLFTATQINTSSPYTATATAINGVVKFENLKLGKYTIEETKAPLGYNSNSLKLIDENSTEQAIIEVTNDNAHRVLTANNERLPGEIEIVKYQTGSSQTPLTGGLFALMNGNDQVATASAVEGKITFGGLDWGTYTVKELKAPNGYDKDSFKVGRDEFVVTSTSIKVVDVATNNKLGSIVLDKVDGDKPLSGGEFTLKKDGVFYATTSAVESTGQIVFKDLPWGTYTVEETKAPTGYDKGSLVITDSNTTITAIEVTNGAIDHKYTANNKRLPGKIEITKSKLGESDVALSGGEFALILDNKEVATTAAVKGKITFGGLEWGTYKVVEKVAPSGYDKNTFSIKNEVFEITAGALGFNVEATNALQTGWIHIDKLDSSTEVGLNGGLFALVDDKGDTIATSSALAGNVDFVDVPLGTYTVKELEAPKGYDKDSFTLDGINVSVDDQCEEKSVEDQRYFYSSFGGFNDKLGSISLLKLNSEDDSPISGGEFGIIKDNQLVATATAINGIVNFPDLPWGEYEVVEIEAAEGFGVASFTIVDADGETISPMVTVDGELLNVSLTAYNTPVLGDLEEDDDDDPNVLPDFRVPSVTKVLGDIAKTGDTVAAIPYMIILLLAAIAIITFVVFRMRRRED